MIQVDEDALICDFAETYQILDYRRLPVQLAASLAVGLKPDSRMKMRMAGMKVPLDSILLAAIVDRLSLLVWAQTKDASMGRNKPQSLLADFVSPQKNKNIVTFVSGKDYEIQRAEMVARIKEG